MVTEQKKYIETQQKPVSVKYLHNWYCILLLIPCININTLQSHKCILTVHLHIIVYLPVHNKYGAILMILFCHYWNPLWNSSLLWNRSSSCQICNFRKFLNILLGIHACSNPSPLTNSMQLYFRNYMKYCDRLLS